MDNQEIEIESNDKPFEMEIEASNVIPKYEENVIESISVNGIEQEVDENKNVDIEVPTKTSDLDNDSNFVADTNYIHTDNNYTTAEKTKLANLSNYDDTEVKQDISNIKSEQTTQNTKIKDLEDNKADTSDIPDVSSFITKDVNNLTNYTLKTNTGSLIDLEINGTTYVVTLSLKDIDGNVISTDTIDLPLESVVVGGSFDSVNKKIVLTLENGNTVDIPVGALISGLQTEITSQNKLASDLVDDTNSGNKFVTTSEKQTWNDKLDESDLTDYVKNTDYASNSKAGVVRGNTAYGINYTANGNIYGISTAYATYQNALATYIISKGTLENVIENSIILKGTTAPTTSTVGYRIGQLYLNTTDNTVYQLTAIDNGTYTWQQLIRTTDYASESKAGVIKANNGNGFRVSANGYLTGYAHSYSTYQQAGGEFNISKGTLENVIAGKELVNKTYVDTIVGDIESILEELDIGGGV